MLVPSLALCLVGAGHPRTALFLSCWSWPQQTSTSASLCPGTGQIFPGLILSDIKPAKRMKFKTVCYLLVQLMHCRKMFKAEIPFSSATCGDDKVGPCSAGAARGSASLPYSVGCLLALSCHMSWSQISSCIPDLSAQ